jgi:16S rRNA (guanine(966)-N(2))-methyltransferase RsmD
LSKPRIISGTAKGLVLQDVPGDITRPITDRVKESLFNIIGADIKGTSILDLFGGTGSVGIEALSRGAEFARFIDLNRAAVNVIKANLQRSKLAGKAEVIQSDAFDYLNRPPDRKFEYVYIAPPQYKEMWCKALERLDQATAWLTLDAWVIVQIAPQEYKTAAAIHLKEFDQRKYGSTLLIFYSLED